MFAASGTVNTAHLIAGRIQCDNQADVRGFVETLEAVAVLAVMSASHADPGASGSLAAA